MNKKGSEKPLASDEKDTESMGKKAGRPAANEKEKGRAKTGQQDAERLRELEEKLEESNDKFLRLFSEFDNFRKRTTRERLELIKTAAEDVISALLPVLDDLERACKMQGKDGETAGTDDGILLIYNKFKAILRQKGVEEIPALGEPFDTDLHEAVTHIPASGKEQKGKVVDELQKGYKLNGRVIRFARVVVAS